ncbi:hypothetical protein Tco_0952269 [Tanacetum coccineum]|uniref:No apical meristem-associated C-terminal domain-containing protein n=1 Tax=Tanacetum coccineum TaxID=301880 RepID=A0ABQ5E338_9ASTR
MAEIGCNWARIGPSKSSQSLSIAHKWAVEIEWRAHLFQEDAKTQGRYDQDIDVTTASVPITTAGVSVSTAEPKKKRRGSKEKSSEPATRPTRGVTMQEPSESGIRKSVPPFQLINTRESQMIKTREIIERKSDLDKFDKEMARRIAEELEVELEEE